MNTKALILAFSALACGSTLLAGGENLPPGLLKLRDIFQAIPAITTTSTTTFEFSPAYYVVNRVTHQECPGHTVKMRLVFSGAMFRVEEDMVKKNGELWDDEVRTYDTHSFQRLDRMRGLIYSQEKLDIFDARPSAMDQFGFLAAFLSDKPMSVKLEDMKSNTVWDRALSKMRLLGPRKIAGQDVMRFEIRDVHDPMGNITSRYEVDLSPAHGYFPMRWAAYTTNGQCFQEYRVTEFGEASHEGASYFYPLKTERRQFGVNETLVSMSESCELFRIDPVDPSLFTIAPAATQATAKDRPTAISTPQ
ncbi:hypothetical protein DB345_05395 [Spartobacteria bacterium LR76]|nr:hypothetical protein DB345_05395 [Spartobacteria bacterium LR76]